MDLRPLLITNSQSAELAGPRQGSFDNPAMAAEAFT